MLGGVGRCGEVLGGVGGRWVGLLFFAIQVEAHLQFTPKESIFFPRTSLFEVEKREKNGVIFER